MRKSISRIWLIFAMVPIMYLLVTGYVIKKDLDIYNKNHSTYINYLIDTYTNDQPSFHKTNAFNLVETKNFLKDTSYFIGQFDIFQHLSIAINFVPILGYELYSVDRLLNLTQDQINNLNLVVKTLESSDLLRDDISSDFQENPEQLLQEISYLLEHEEGLLILLESLEIKTRKVVSRESNRSISGYILLNQTPYGTIQKKLLLETSSFQKFGILIKDGLRLLDNEFDIYAAITNSDDNDAIFQEMRSYSEEVTTLKNNSDFLINSIVDFSEDSSLSPFAIETSGILLNLFEINGHIIESFNLRLNAIADLNFDNTEDKLRLLNTLLRELNPVNDIAAQETDVALSKLDRLSQTKIPVLGQTFDERYKPFMDYLFKSVRELEKIDNWIPVISDIAGVNGDKYFLLLAHSADELRATGGFVSAVWLLHVKEDSSYDLTYYDVAVIDDMNKLHLYPDPPNLLKQHMGAWVWLMRDVSWHPDFIDTSINAQLMFRSSKGIDTDGVIGFNQYALLRVLDDKKIIAKISSEEEIDIRELMSVVQEGTDKVGREYMDDLIRRIIVELSQEIQVDLIFDILVNLEEAFTSKDIMVYLEDSKSSKILNSNNWSGSIKNNEKIRNPIYVIDSNIGWSKVDRNIERETEVSISFPTLNSSVTNIKIAYTNHSSNSQSDCEPQWGTRGISYRDLMNSCYWNLVRILLNRTELLDVKGDFNLPVASVAADLGFSESGNSTIKKDVYNDELDTISGLVVVDEGESKSIEFIVEDEYVELGQYGECLEYTMTLIKQPGVPSRRISVQFHPPDGFRIETISLMTLDNYKKTDVEEFHEGYLKSDIQYVAKFVPFEKVDCI